MGTSKNVVFSFQEITLYLQSFSKQINDFVWNGDWADDQKNFTIHCSYTPQNVKNVQNIPGSMIINLQAILRTFS